MQNWAIINKLFVRNIEAEAYLETFLVSAVTALLTLRFYLTLVGFPQVGAGRFHLAHVLWGGTLMMAAVVILLGYLNRPVKILGALVGGIGFGVFIDELGKLLTRDYNYFFAPTAAIIYVIFIVLYLLFKFIGRDESLSENEKIINVLEFTKDSIGNDLDPDEKKRALYLLSRCDPKNPVVDALYSMIHKFELAPAPKPGLLTKINRFLAGLYHSLVSKKWFSLSIIAFFVTHSLLSLYQVILTGIFLIRNGEVLAEIETETFVDSAKFLFSMTSTIFVILGIIAMHRSRVAAYQMFIRAVLVSIFLTQVFVFYQNQFSALTGLIGDIIILIVLRYAVDREKLERKS